MIAFFVRILEVLFAGGIIGSALVIILTAIEDVGSLSEEKPGHERVRE